MYQNNEMAAILVYGTGISSFLFKYFVLFHHPTGATDHVSENDLFQELLRYFLKIINFVRILISRAKKIVHQSGNTQVRTSK